MQPLSSRGSIPYGDYNSAPYHDSDEEKTDLLSSEETAGNDSEKAYRLYKLGIYDEALKIYRELLNFWEKAEERRPLEIAITQSNIVKCQINLGRFKEAQEENTKVIKLWERLPQNPLDLATSLHHHGRCFYELGDYPQARNYFNRACQIRKKIGGDNFPEKPHFLNDIGHSYFEEGHHLPAKGYFESAHHLVQRKELEKAAILNNLGLCLFKEGKFDVALSRHQEAYNIRKALSGDSHPSLATCANNIGTCFVELKEFDKAIEAFNQAIEIRMRSSDPHSEIATYWNNIGYCYESLTENEKALTNYKKAVTIAFECFKGEHPRILLFLKQVVDVLQKIDDISITKETNDKLHPLCKKYLGREHESTRALKQLGKKQAPKHSLRQALKGLGWGETKARKCEPIN
ncbi:MAG: tetratricopeptide repeat protein [Waddliaceae bacterium]